METNTIALSNEAEKALSSEDQLNDPVDSMERHFLEIPTTQSPKAKLVETSNLDTTENEIISSPKPISQTPQKQPAKNLNSPSPSQRSHTGSNKDSPKMAKSPRNTTFESETPMSLNLAVDKIIDGLATGDGSRFSKIFENTTPTCIDAMTLETTETPETGTAPESQTNQATTPIDEAQQNNVPAVKVDEACFHRSIQSR